jgi:hypothetical protein
LWSTVVEYRKQFALEMFQRLGTTLLAAAFSVALLTAQMHGAMGRPVSGAHAGFARGVQRRNGLHLGSRHGARPWGRGIPLGLPFLDSDYGDSDYDYSDYDAGEPYVSEVDGAQPRVVVVQPAAAHDSARKPKPGPLLIEWRGDRYVRFGGADASEQNGIPARPDYAEPPIANMPAQPPTAELPPAVLVYRDGHLEEIADYTIADGIIYLHGNDWRSGYWTRRIPLSVLDPLATMRANQQRGVKFMLPSAPNVVVASF